MTVELRAAIEGLYAAFGGYGLAAHVPGCPCCTSAADQARIHSAPLRKLTGDDLEAFARSAMLTWGTVDHFRHFLPRMFELVAIDGGRRLIEPEVVFANLSRGG